MGIVVLRSTTPCVAVSSRSNSNLLTVISIVVDVAATAGATSTGIISLPTLLLFSSYIKCKYKKTSSNRRQFGEVENRPRPLPVQSLPHSALVWIMGPGFSGAATNLWPASGFYSRIPQLPQTLHNPGEGRTA